jgi:hypothetical protein
MFTLYRIVFRSNVKKTRIRTFLESYMSRVLNTVVELLRESLRSTTRPAQRRGLNFISRMSAKQFDYCNKYLTFFQITSQTATFG